MIPRGEGGILVRDLESLTRSGLGNIIFISVHTTDRTNRDNLIAGADSLTQTLSSAGFTFTSQASIRPDKVIAFLLDNAPNLMTQEDLSRLNSLLTPESIRTNLEKALRTLNSPQSMGMKKIIRRDPLDLRTILLPRLKAFSSLSHARVLDDHIFSPDGTAILLTAKSPIPLTDTEGSARLLKTFEDATKDLPSGVKADMISGHVHSNANAVTIQNDLTTISCVATLAMGLLFIFFFRTCHALGVFLTPLISMSVGLGGLALFEKSVSAIVIGFGAVIIGISIDFAMHVYFSVIRHSSTPGKGVDSVAKPIFFCALTSCAAFGALFLSGMPGMRQLALFSIVGLLASAIFSFVVLPHLSRKGLSRPPLTLKKLHGKQHPIFVLCLACLFVGTCLWYGTSVTLDPDLRSIEYVPETVRITEKQFNETWGDVRNKALVFTQGTELATTLSQNEQLYSTLKTNFPQISVASLTPILPAFTTQAENRARWNDFWTDAQRQSVVESLQASARELGFSSKAFAPFIRSLSHTPTQVTPERLDTASLALLRNIFLPDLSAGDPTLVTYLPDSANIRSFFTPKRETNLGVRLVSTSRFKTLLETTMKNDIELFITVSGIAVLVLTFLLFRNIRRASIALLPAIAGVAAVIGGLGYSGTPLNLFHITALPLIIGLGADYGIFLVSSESQSLEQDTILAVIVSGLTTLAGFGVLALARHPSLNALGTMVLLGVGTALFVALFMVPHLLRKQS
ncbi:MMPL family transporter [Pseudodesulfovibrio sediminis]|nr:MMPL family transporter [Pseudodesulfovibrio sediminis]